MLYKILHSVKMNREEFCSSFHSESEFPDWLKAELDLVYTRMKNTHDANFIKVGKDECSARAISILKKRKFKVWTSLDFPTGFFGHWRWYYKIYW